MQSAAPTTRKAATSAGAAKPPPMLKKGHADSAYERSSGAHCPFLCKLHLTRCTYVVMGLDVLLAVLLIVHCIILSTVANDKRWKDVTGLIEFRMFSMMLPILMIVMLVFNALIQGAIVHKNQLCLLMPIMAFRCIMITLYLPLIGLGCSSTNKLLIKYLDLNPPDNPPNPANLSLILTALLFCAVVYLGCGLFFQNRLLIYLKFKSRKKKGRGAV